MQFSGHLNLLVLSSENCTKKIIRKPYKRKSQCALRDTDQGDEVGEVTFANGFWDGGVTLW